MLTLAVGLRSIEKFSVIPIVLPWETIACAFSCDSSIHAPWNTPIRGGTLQTFSWSLNVQERQT